MHKGSKQSKVALTGNFAPLGQAPETPYDVNAHAYVSHLWLNAHITMGCLYGVAGVYIFGAVLG